MFMHYCTKKVLIDLCPVIIQLTQRYALSTLMAFFSLDSSNSCFLSPQSKTKLMGMQRTFKIK